MEKKEFKAPAITVTKLRCYDVICTSGQTGQGTPTENIPKGSFGVPEPDHDEEDYIWVD